MLLGCDPEAFVQHNNISQETWGVGCPLLTNRVGGPSPNKESHGRENKYWEEISAEKLNHGGAERVWLYKFTWEGRGRGGRVAWEIEGMSIACGSYAASGSDFSRLQDVFTCRSACLPIPHVTTLQAACIMARKGRLRADCPNTFSKDLLIKTLQCGSIFRCTS